MKDNFFLEYATCVNKEEARRVSTIEETVTSVLRPPHGSNRSQPIQEKETINLKEVYDSLLSKIKAEEEPGDYGLLHLELLQDAHKNILRGLPLPTNATESGKLSNARRITEFQGEIYEYPCPEESTKAVYKLLDQYNSLFHWCTKNGLDAYEDYYKLFRLCALNFLIYIHFQMEMEDSAEFLGVIYSPSLHRFQH